MGRDAEILRAMKQTTVKLPPGLGSVRKGQVLKSGMVPERAVQILAGQGMDAAEARRDIEAWILRHFPRFANSWDVYIENHGFMTDAPRLKAAGHGDGQAAGDLLKLPGSVSELVSNPAAVLGQPEKVGSMLDYASMLNRRDSDHPAQFMLVRLYGLHPLLAQAVMQHSRVVPWWAYWVILIFTVICGSTFIQAIVDPHNPGFENESVGGVGPLHYIVLPLLTLAFASALVWLIRDRPRREQAWRKILQQYRDGLDA